MSSKKIVGITGGIGSGKTFVCRILESMGYPVFYSDQEAKNILVHNKEVKQQIKSIFGVDAYLIDGELNRKYLAKQIFNHKGLLTQMNQVVHPAVRAKFIDWANKQDSNIVLNEAAILFETGIYKNYDAVILVTAPKNTKIKRIQKRDKTTVVEIEKRMNSQWSDEQKIPLANFIINNDDHVMLLPQINEIIDKLNSI